MQVAALIPVWLLSAFNFQKLVSHLGLFLLLLGMQELWLFDRFRQVGLLCFADWLALSGMRALGSIEFP